MFSTVYPKLRSSQQDSSLNLNATEYSFSVMHEKGQNNSENNTRKKPGTILCAVLVLKCNVSESMKGQNMEVKGRAIG